MGENFTSSMMPGGIPLSGVPGTGSAPSLTYGAPGQVTAPSHNIFAEFFGEPNGPVNSISPYDLFPRSSFHLPDAYVGNNRYLVSVLIKTITESDMLLGRIALPFKIADGMVNSIVWDEARPPPRHKAT